MATLENDLSASFERIETHISWVFRSERDVYKVKKPVDLGFLDFTDLEKRRAACNAEVTLNRRLSPSVYFGVVPITRDPQGRHAIGGAGETVDWAVHMRRLPDADRADIRLAQGRLGEEQLDAIVSRIASFHEDIGPSPLADSCGGPASVHVNIEENFEQTAELLPRYLNPDQIAELLAWQRHFVDRHGDVLARRSREGRVREGHGDLRLEHIYLRDDGGIDVLDCIEFNLRFRIADVCADIVFLAMDLAQHGRADLAERALAVYARESNDFDMYGLVDFYASYRAFVRGKVSAFIAESRTVDNITLTQAEEQARRYFLLALASDRRLLVPPVLIAVGGIIASGKSTVANCIAADLSAPVVNADRTRKYLAGIEPKRPVDAAAFEGMYSVEFTDKTYDEVMRRAAHVLRSGRPVVLDASFRTRATRDRARKIASDCGVQFLFVECKVDETTCLRRLEERARERGVSDGRVEIFQDFVNRWEPVTELADDQHVIVDTSLPLAENIKSLSAVIPTWPQGLTGP